MGSWTMNGLILAMRASAEYLHHMPDSIKADFAVRMQVLRFCALTRHKILRMSSSSPCQLRVDCALPRE